MILVPAKGSAPSDDKNNMFNQTVYSATITRTYRDGETREGLPAGEEGNQTRGAPQEDGVQTDARDCH